MGRCRYTGAHKEPSPVNVKRRHTDILILAYFMILVAVASDLVGKFCDIALDFFGLF